MRRFFSLLLLITVFSCYDTERNCNAFKTGEFEFDYTINGVKKTGRFIRTETLNIDYYENNIDTSTVRWINDCEFILKKLNPKTNAEKDAIHMKILSTSGTSSYTFEYKLVVNKPNRPQRIEKGVAYKIN
ncbi:hypothetical protein [uncultured Winogradskyella sp.]|uniref:hypothetical protein n=1 Tax=uncultured Winogradskyella sp. TaxID=395353 RepID=UPI002614927B|nr:hypothetical protein [uncultured Winogradskyella sp.]